MVYISWLVFRTPHMNETITVEQEQISGHESKRGLGTKTDRLIGNCNVTDFDLILVFRDRVKPKWKGFVPENVGRF
jgi:hypothetical protein